MIKRAQKSFRDLLLYLFSIGFIFAFVFFCFAVVLLPFAAAFFVIEYDPGVSPFVLLCVFVLVSAIEFVILDILNL